MRAQCSRWLVRGGLLFALLASCGNDEAVGDRGTSAGYSGNCLTCAGESSGGDGSSGSAEGGTPVATAGKAPIAGSSSGTSAGGTGGTHATPGGEGGGAGEPVGPLMEELTLCNRLSKTYVLEAAHDVVSDFQKEVYFDCRVRWLVDLYIVAKMVKEYQNALWTWNQRFWGCQAEPVSDFPLVFGTPPLSQGDADIVIDHYLDVAIAEFQLTSQEQGEMRTALEHLAITVIVSDSDEPSQPSCEGPGTGGAGGASENGGAGGSAGSESGGSGGSSTGGTGEIAGTSSGGAP